MAVIRHPSWWQNLIGKSHYWYRPQQIAHRALHELRQPGPVVTVRLPWGFSISCRRDEMIGQSIIRTGVFELATTELLLRLTDPGDLAIDVGANIGYMTSVLARGVSPGGRVMAFEPNPAVVELLKHNASRWRGRRDVVIEIRGVGVSDSARDGWLELPPGYGSNQGTARVRSEHRGSTPDVPIDLVSLDDELTSESVGMMKLDVEGHEEAVVQGAEHLLAEGRVRDVVYEELGTFPSGVSRVLEQHGFRVFDVVQLPRGVRLLDPSDVPRPSWTAPMLLGTRAPERALERTRRLGWTALRSPRRT